MNPSTRPSPSFRKATESFNHLWYNLKNGNQSALKGALYNFVIVVAVAAVVAVCLVLGPFLKPLLWSVLIGAVLFPFKCSIAFWLKKWFVRLEDDDTHLLVGIALAPLEALEAIGGYLSSLFMKHMQLILAGALSLLLLGLFISYAPKGLACVLWKQLRWGHTMFTNVLGSIDYTIVIAVIIVYITVLVWFWKQENSFYFMWLGQTLWIVLVAYGCSFLGALQVPLFLASLIYALVGVVYDFKARFKTNQDEVAENTTISEKITSFLKVPTFYTTGDLTTPMTSPNTTATLPSVEELDVSAGDETIASKLRLDIKSTSFVEPEEEIHSGPKSQSEIYFKALFLACIATLFYNHVWMVIVVFVPIFVYIANQVMVAFCVVDIVQTNWTDLTSGIREWIIVRHSAILPVCLPGVLRLNRKIHKTVRNAMHESIDTASSILMIVLLLFTVIFAGIFCAVEIYSETITVVQLGNDVVNWTLYHRPELMDMFPEGVTNSVDDVIENAYQYGRTGIGTYVDELLKDADAEKRTNLKNQLLSVWDRLIQYWLDRKKDNGFNGPQVPASAITDSIGEIVNNEELFSVAQQGLIGWVKKNVDILMEVMNSVWVIVQANLSVLTSICGTMMSLFLGGGQAVITFIINSIIFLTALFYLLSSSGDRYAPLAAASSVGFSSGPRIAEAIEASVSSVLFASAKLALFHGLFTWLTHTIFGARVVFLPSVLASILAALPFLGTYWCSIPAFLDLWLIQDRFSLGVILILIHFLFPSSFVDPAIYADVNGGGHAYLTGLSIAGGMFWLGWEGAIFGPILLCLLVVIFNLTSNAFKESPTTPRPSVSDYRVTDRRHSSFQNPF